MDFEFNETIDKEKTIVQLNKLIAKSVETSKMIDDFKDFFKQSTTKEEFGFV